MMNRRLSLETNPNPIIEDTMVHPINPQQEKRNYSLDGPSSSTRVVEQAKSRWSLGDVSIPTSSQIDNLQSQDQAHES